MPVCATAIQQSDGSYLLGLDPSNTNLSTCAYVVDTGSDSQIAQLMNLDPNTALVISSCVGALWAMAWGWRLLGTILSYEASE